MEESSNKIYMKERNVSKPSRLKEQVCLKFSEKSGERGGD